MIFTASQESAIAGFDARLGAGAFLREIDGATDFSTLWSWNCNMQVSMIAEQVAAATAEMNRLMTPNACNNQTPACGRSG